MVSRGVVAARADPAHRPSDAVVLRPVEYGLRPAVGVQNRAGDVALADRVAGRRDRQGRFHPRVDGVANDLVRVDVLNRAEMDFALVGAMLGGGASRRRLPAGECPSTTVGSAGSR